MLISHKHKFLFLHVPKSAGTSIRSALASYSEVRPTHTPKHVYNHHVRANHLKSHFESQKWNWSEYFKFTFFRNPWDITASIWHYAHKCIQETKGIDTSNWANSDWFVRAKRITNLNNFDEFVFNYVSYDTQLSFAFDENNNLIVDFIGDFDNLNKDFNTICQKIGITTPDLPKLNQSSSRPYQSLYSQKSIDHVHKIYKKTIDYMNFSF